MISADQFQLNAGWLFRKRLLQTLEWYHHRSWRQMLLVRVFVKVNVSHRFLSPESGNINWYIQVTKNHKRQKIFYIKKGRHDDRPRRWLKP